MHKVVKVSPPQIEEGSVLPNPILTLDELFENTSRVKPLGKWTKYGKNNHAKLSIYLDDGTEQETRSLWVQLKGHSKWGLGFYRGDGDSACEEKTKSNKLINLDYDSSPEVQRFNSIMNAIVERIATGTYESGAELKKSLDAPFAILAQRPTARSTGASVDRTMRLTCYAGQTQLENKDKLVSMHEFPEESGDYLCIIEIRSLDANLTGKGNNAISFGPVLTGRAIRTITMPRAPLVWREEGDPSTTEKQVKKEEGKEKEQSSKKKRKENPMKEDEFNL